MGEPGRRAAAGLLALGALLGCAPGAVALEPSVTVTSPRQYADRGADAPGDIAGWAAAPSGVRSVTVSLFDLDRRVWWRGGDNWGARRELAAALAAPGAERTAWRVPWPSPRPGSYRLFAEARDGDSRVATLPEVRSFDVADGSGHGHLTLLFGRTQWAMNGGGCERMRGSVPLGRVARALARRGLAATGAVVVDQVGDGRCRGLVRHATWRGLAALRDRYGWSFVSAGTSYLRVGSLPPARQREVSCGSLDDFAARGHGRAWGLFAYPGDSGTASAQSAVVSDCFAFGRTYAWGRNHRSLMREPWFQRTHSLDGGACHNTSRACYRIRTPVFAARYRHPRQLGRLMAAGGGEWSVVQVYRLVKGRRLTGDVRWDCTDPSPRNHWTTRIELYCIRDFLDAVDRIRAGVTVADPAAVARAWGRSPG